MSPDVRFRGQPFEASDSVGQLLKERLADPEVDSVTIVAAWVRFGGLRRLKPDIDGFRSRGGRLRILLGIDEGVASRPGLLLASNLADEAFVFHDRSARTFHPKVYLCEGETKAWLLVGSSNVTAGGLFANYEASLEVEFDLPNECDAEALQETKRWIDHLQEDRELCLPLTEAMVEQLGENSRYSISRGERRAPHVRLSTSDPDLFGLSGNERTAAPALPKAARGEREELEGLSPVPPVPAAAIGLPGRVRAFEAWSKVLSRSDAQHPMNPSTNPLGNVRLTRGNSTVNWRIWFREELFGEEDWQPRTDTRGNATEIAAVPFHVTIDGEEVGVADLDVDHAPHRESGQDNHATVLHWGPLAPIIRGTDYSGYTLTLERMTRGTYHLDISP